MKRFLALAALVLGVVSCQTEPEGLDVIVGGEVDTVITVNIPESETRANAGTNSAEGAFTNGVLGTESDNTTMRYIFQVYYNGETSDDKHHRQVAYSDGTSVSFPVRLIPGRDYRFVVWADVVADGKNDTDLHYNTDDLTNITLEGDWNAMDETRDAFTAYKDVVQYNGQQAINIDLYRPFAKLRVLTTDFDVLESYGVSAKYATVEYTTEHRAGFNAYTGAAAAASETKTHRYEIANYSTETNASRTIFSDYFFAENDVVSFNLYVYEDEARTKLIKQIAFNTDINVKRNYLTTLKGNVLTDGNKVNIEVKPGLGGTDDPDYNYNVLTSGDELVAAIANGGSYKVGNNIYVADTRAALATRAAAGQTTTILNLNGYKIIFEEGATIEVPVGKTLIINDETENNTGAIEAGNNAGFDNKGTIKIESGIVGESSIDNNGGTVNIEGGDLATGAVQNNSGTANIVGDNIDNNVVNGEVTDYYAGIIKAFAEGGEFTLGASLKLEQPLTLANGKTLKLTIAEGAVLSIVDTTSKNFQLIDNRGTLTVEGAGKMTVEATINSGWSRYSAVIANNPGGNLTVKGVTLEHLGGTDMAYGIDNLTNGKGTYAVATINEGAVVKSTYRAIRQFLNGIEATNELYVNAGAVVEGANKSIWMQDPSANANTGKLVVNEGATLNGDAYLSVTAGSTEWPVSVKIANAAFAEGYTVVTSNVPADYKVVEKNGVWTVVPNFNDNFAENTWENIIKACQNNSVPESWNVGDTKAMTIAGKEYQIRVIGKNHDTYTAGGRAPLTFQIAEVCGSAAMNATQTNTTGWSGSQMRTVTMPEILAAMPVKDAIKAVNKETLNGTRDGLETTSDKLFLLSEVEVNGSVYFSNNFAEGSRYAFYTCLESQIMNASYWLRGPGKNNAIGFTQINSSGYMANGSAECACGVVFGFCF